MNLTKENKVPAYLMDKLQQDMQRMMIHTEEVVIRAVLKNHLGRDATIEDAKLCTQIISNPYDGSYRLLYSGNELGVVKYIYGTENFRVEFYPVQKHN